MFSRQALLVKIERFQNIDSFGNLFYAPYMINLKRTEDKSLPRGLGKSSPEEISRSVEYIKQTHGPISGDEIRKKLVSGTLISSEMNYKAIDCSGFVYTVFSSLFHDCGVDLSETVTMPKEQLVRASSTLSEWQEAHRLTTTELTLLPNHVPIRWIADVFKREPINLCGVQGFSSNQASREVAMQETEIGDLLVLRGQIPHIAIITNILPEGFEIAHSTRSKNSVGGVMFQVIEISVIKNGKIELNDTMYDAQFRRLKVKKA